jgi:predicted MFS family arabinose efflux permease
MKISDNTPLWVTLAYGNINTRKSALILIVCSVIFTVYCFPWAHFSQHPMVARLFLIKDWSWFAVMLPMIVWYWLSLKWVDKHEAWGN